MEQKQYVLTEEEILIAHSLLTNFDFLELEKIINFINLQISLERKKRTNHHKFSEENIEMMINTIDKNKHF